MFLAKINKTKGGGGRAIHVAGKRLLSVNYIVLKPSNRSKPNRKMDNRHEHIVLGKEMPVHCKHKQILNLTIK